MACLAAIERAASVAGIGLKVRRGLMCGWTTSGIMRWRGKPELFRFAFAVGHFRRAPRLISRGSAVASRSIAAMKKPAATDVGGGLSKILDDDLMHLICPTRQVWRITRLPSGRTSGDTQPPPQNCASARCSDSNSAAHSLVATLATTFAGPGGRRHLGGPR